MNNYSGVLGAVAQTTGIPLSGAKLSFVSASIRTAELRSAADATCVPTEQGFFADLAFRAVMAEKDPARPDQFPILVLLSKTKPYANWADISHFMNLYTDLDFYLHTDGVRFEAFDFYGSPRAIPLRGRDYTSRNIRQEKPEGLENFFQE